MVLLVYTWIDAVALWPERGALSASIWDTKTIRFVAASIPIARLATGARPFQAPDFKDDAARLIAIAGARQRGWFRLGCPSHDARDGGPRAQSTRDFAAISRNNGLAIDAMGTSGLKP